jgi:hypothetical protein
MWQGNENGHHYNILISLGMWLGYKQKVLNISNIGTITDL